MRKFGVQAEQAASGYEIRSLMHDASIEQFYTAAGENAEGIRKSPDFERNYLITL